MKKRIEKPAICYETSTDESFLVGTKEELSALAHSILELTRGPLEPNDLFGIKASSPKSEKYLTEVMCDVSISGISIVDTVSDRRTLINRIRMNHEELPIDWESRDNLLSKDLTRRSSQRG